MQLQNSEQDISPPQFVGLKYHWNFFNYTYKYTVLNFHSVKFCHFKKTHPSDTRLARSLKKMRARPAIWVLSSIMHVAISLIWPLTLIMSFRIRWASTSSVFLRTGVDSSRNLQGMPSKDSVFNYNISSLPTHILHLILLITRPQHLQAAHKMWPIATDVARSMYGLCVCLLVTRMCCAKTA